MAAWWIDADPCPSWCAGLHSPDDHPDDRVHESPGRLVPMVVRDSAGRRVNEDVAVVVFRRAGSETTYLCVGSGPSHELAVALPYAPALIGAIWDVLAEVEA